MNPAAVAILAWVSIPANGTGFPGGAGILHPLAVVGESPVRVEGMETSILSPMDAARTSFELLEAMGATGVLVCEVSRIEAPLSAYIVDAVGSMPLSGRVFDSFRLVLRDGSEYDGEVCPPGEQIAFIAHRVDPSGEEIWYPLCGPDYAPTRDEPALSDAMLQFEFLLGREAFESLASRYPRPESGDAAE